MESSSYNMTRPDAPVRHSENVIWTYVNNYFLFVYVTSYKSSNRQNVAKIMNHLCLCVISDN